jgi:hypothetical protein
MMNNPKRDGLRGYVLVGEAEPQDSHQYIGAAVAMLNEVGVPTELEVVPGVGHAYPADFAAYVSRALAFVMSEDEVGAVAAR